MTEPQRDITADFGLADVGQFQPHARYHHGMDMLVYLTVDCSYSAERVDEHLTLFWHPHWQRLVGVKIKGFRHAFLRLKDKCGWSETDFLPLVRFMEGLMQGGLGDEIMKSQERRRKYELA